MTKREIMNFKKELQDPKHYVEVSSDSEQSYIEAEQSENESLLSDN
jgi:hypothetical protein